MADLSSLATSRQITLRTVVRILLDRGAVSRAELARLTGLSKQTMSEVFRHLEDGGWVQMAGRTQGAVGRSAAIYEVCADRALVFGADVGGTKIQAALADMRGRIVSELVEPTDARGGRHVIEQLARINATLASRAGLPADRVLVGSVGIPGAFDLRSKRLFMVPNIAGLEGSFFAKELEALVTFDVAVGNDVNMAAKGELWMGEGKGIDNFVFIALGTGVGMGIINERRILRGARGAAGEIATLPVGASGYDARTFHSGVLETMIGSAAIRDRYEGAGGQPGLTVRQIIDRIEGGDRIAGATLDEVARTLAEAILAVSAIVDPERVVLGGSIGARTELLDRVRHFLPLCMPTPPECTISRLGSRAALYGTIASSLDLLYENLFQTAGYDLLPGTDAAEAGG
ncbi:ROK family protein [Pseudaminobacter sp. 19-2017]|uniref:ROK family protein n=1 Tax=Pseudaminobacter soli (ex Zhang et al. 2022) TaxID=2831468 RepID=A0A942EAW9_9HYPH|nr:ROK family transcriptional regulator [Pseudaminobacter soli]MBS3651702.1 ROK family protein [Pseudaminobacter soli]